MERNVRFPFVRESLDGELTLLEGILDGGEGSDDSLVESKYERKARVSDAAARGKKKRVRNRKGRRKTTEEGT